MPAAPMSPGRVEVDAELAAELGGRLHLHRTATAVRPRCDPHRVGQRQPYRVYSPFARACRAQATPAQPLPAPEPACPDGRHCRRSDRSTIGACCRAAPGLGRRLARESGTPARRRRRRGWPHSSRRRRRLRDAAATCPGRTAPPGSRRICTSARSRRARSGTPPARGAPGDGLETYLGETAVAGVLRPPALAPPGPAGAAAAPGLRRHAVAPTTRPALRAWQRGRTGFPIVDAGMRQLWQTGWMHNRVRMIAASFLVKHLLIALAARASLVLGHAGRRRPRQQRRELAVGRRLRRRRRALFPHLQPGAAGREVRPARRLCAPLGARARRAAGPLPPRALDGAGAGAARRRRARSGEPIRAPIVDLAADAAAGARRPIALTVRAEPRRDPGAAPAARGGRRARRRARLRRRRRDRPLPGPARRPHRPRAGQRRRAAHRCSG